MSKRVDSHGTVYAPHNSTDACSIGTESNNLHVNVKGEDYIQIGDGDKVKFTKAVDFTGVTVTGIQAGGISDTLTLTSTGNDTVNVKNDSGKFKVERVTPNGTVEQLRMDVDADGGSGTDPELVVKKTKTGKVTIEDLAGTADEVLIVNDNAGLRVTRDPTGGTPVQLMAICKPRDADNGTYTSQTAQFTVGDSTTPHLETKVHEPLWDTIVLENGVPVVNTNVQYSSTINGSTDAHPNTYNITGYGDEKAPKDIATIDRILYSNEIVTPFKKLVIEGGMHRVATGPAPQDAANPTTGEFRPGNLGQGVIGDSGDTYSTTFRNPITIHQYQHDFRMYTSQPAEMSVTTRNNSFTCDCSATFNGNVAVDNKQLRVPDYYTLYFNTNIVTPHTSRGPSTVLISSTDSWNLNGAPAQINTLPTGRYKVLISQTGSSNQNGISEFQATFDLIVNTSNNDTDGSPVLDIGASFHHVDSVHGKPKIEYEILANGAWKVHLLFDTVSSSHTNDHFDIVPKIREELW